MEHGGKIIPRGVRSGIVLYTQQLEDMTLTNLATNDILVRSGTKWVNCSQPYNMASSYPFARVQKVVTSQSLPPSVDTIITFTELTDPLNLFAGGETGGSTNQFTIPFAGVWQFELNIDYPGNVNGYRQATIRQISGGNTYTRGIVRVNSVGSADTTPVCVVATFTCLAGDNVQAVGRQTSGTTLSLSATNTTTTFTAKYVGKS